MRNNRADVVEGALRVLDAHGLEFCSMRRIAAALDVQPSALYHHVPDKQTLLALMADEIVGGVRGDTPEELCGSLRAALLSIRDGAEVVATATAFQMGGSAVETRLTQLVGENGARTLLHFVFGHTQATQTRLTALEVGALPEATQGHRGMSEASAEQQVSFDRGVAIILAGIRELVPPTDR